MAILLNILNTSRKNTKLRICLLLLMILYCVEHIFLNQHGVAKLTGCYLKTCVYNTILITKPFFLYSLYFIDQIDIFRRYGVVESRFCFEGGSRCGKGEGLYVLVSDQGNEITRIFRLAAEGKLSSKKRPASRSASGNNNSP